MTRGNRWIRLAGLLTGAVLAAAFVWAGRVPAQGGELPVRVEVTTARAGDLAATPGHRLVPAQRIHPGRVLNGALLLTNATEVRLAARPRVRDGKGELDRTLQLRLVAEGEVVFSGSLEKLRRRGGRAFTVPAGATRSVWVSAWLRPAGDDFQGRSAQVRLDWSTDVAR